MLRYNYYKQDNWTGYVSTDFDMPDEPILQWLDKCNQTPTKAYPSRILSFRETSHGNEYIKTMLGLGGNPHSFVNSLKWFLGKSRALHVWQISKEAAEAGFNCCQVSLALRHRSGFRRPIDLLITRQAPGKRMRDLFLQPGFPSAQRERILILAAKELARLHNASFVHGDCNPGNIFFDQSNDSFCFIDNDRTRKLPAPLLRIEARRNIVQFAFRLALNHNMNQQDRLPFLNEYISNVHEWTHKDTDWVNKRVDERMARGY